MTKSTATLRKEKAKGREQEGVVLGMSIVFAFHKELNVDTDLKHFGDTFT